MKIGPGRKWKSASRWFQIDEPVTSEGIRSGVNWIRLKPMLVTCANERAVERLRETRVVLEQHVPVGEQPHQDELERVALADDGALDLVEDPRCVLLDLGELHQSASSASTASRSEAMSRPGAKRSRGGSRSPRTISQVSSPSARRAASGLESSSIPRRAASSSAATPRSRGRRR